MPNPLHLPLATLDEILDAMHPQDQWAIDNFYSEDEGQILAAGIIQGNATAVSDGSFKDQLGTSGFILRGSQRQLSVIGDNVVLGSPTEQSSYRSELAGISGILAVLAAVCKKYDVQDGSVTLALDGEQALLKAGSVWPLSPTDTDFDLLTDIRAKILKLPISIIWQWIRGHQDRNIAFDSLSGLAQDNVMADNIAKQRLNQCLLDAHVPASQRFGDEGWSISWRGVKLSKLDYRRLYSLMWTGPALEYWARKHRLEYGTILTIDWDTCGDALRSLSFARRRRVVKQASGHLGVGRVLQRWGLQNHSECPRCQGDETPIHVLRCPDPRALTVWETTLANLSTWMLRKQTDPAIQQTIIRRLREWHDGHVISDATHGSPLWHAITNQNDIGWYPFLLGLMSPIIGAAFNKHTTTASLLTIRASNGSNS